MLYGLVILQAYIPPLSIMIMEVPLDTLKRYLPHLSVVLACATMRD